MQNDNQFKPGKQPGQRPPYPPQRPASNGYNNPQNPMPNKVGHNQAPQYQQPQQPSNMPLPATARPSQPTPAPQSSRQTLPTPGQQPTYPNQNLHQQPQPMPPRPQAIHQPINQPVNSVDQESRPKRKSRKEEIRNTIYTVALFILAPLFAVFMIVFVFQSYVVDGSSMEPTLDNGDRVFILKLPETLANIRNDVYIPSRNEIIVFKKPGVGDTQLIKRVIGLPGDRVVIENGEITIYNIDNPAGFDPGDGTDYIANLETYNPEDPVVEANVGEGELFVLGDNRTPGGSLDSHSGLGLVPVENVVGRLWIRYFPLSSFELFSMAPALDTRF